MPDSTPVTKTELKEALGTFRAELKAELKAEITELIEAVESRMFKRFERMETTLLTGFHSQMRGQEARLARACRRQ